MLGEALLIKLSFITHVMAVHDVMTGIVMTVAYRMLLKTGALPK